MLGEEYAMPTMSLVYRSAFGDVGMFDERYGIGEDMEVGLRLTMRGRCRMLYVPKTLYRYRRRSGQATASWLRVLRQLKRAGRDWSAGMDPARWEEYAKEYNRFVRARLFLYGAWAYANRGSNAAQSAPGAGPARRAAACSHRSAGTGCRGLRTTRPGRAACGRAYADGRTPRRTRGRSWSQNATAGRSTRARTSCASGSPRPGRAGGTPAGCRG